MSRNSDGGFTLVGALVAGVIFAIISAGIVKTMSSALRNQTVVQQLNDFDTLKTNIKAVFLSDERCTNAFRDSTAQPAYFQVGNDLVFNTRAVQIYSIFLFQGPIVTIGDSVGGGSFIDDIALEPVHTAPIEVVKKQLAGDISPRDYHRRLVRLLVHSSGAGSQSFQPRPQISVLTDPTALITDALGVQHEKMVGCDASGGIALTALENPLSNKGCGQGKFISGFDNDGAPICGDLPEQQKLTASCPSGQVLSGIDGRGVSICTSATTVAENTPISLNCPAGQYLTGISNGTAICSAVSASLPRGTIAGLCIPSNSRGMCESAYPPALCDTARGIGSCSCSSDYTPVNIGAGAFGAVVCMRN